MDQGFKSHGTKVSRFLHATGCLAVPSVLTNFPIIHPCEYPSSFSLSSFLSFFFLFLSSFLSFPPPFFLYFLFSFFFISLSFFHFSSSFPSFFPFLYLSSFFFTPYMNGFRSSAYLSPVFSKNGMEQPGRPLSRWNVKLCYGYPYSLYTHECTYKQAHTHTCVSACDTAFVREHSFHQRIWFRYTLFVV